MNTSKVVKDTFHYLLARNLLIPLHTLGTILLIRLLTPWEYGKWVLLWNFISTGALILSFGWLNTLSKFLPEISDPNEKKKLFSSAFTTVCLACLVLFIPYLLFFSFSSLVPLEMKSLRIPFFIFLSFSALFTVFDGYYRGEGRYKFWTILCSFRTLLAILASLFLLTLFTKQFEMIFYSYFGVTTLFLIVLVLCNKEKLSIHSLTIEKSIQHFLIIAFVNQIAFTLYSNLDPVLIRILMRKSNELAFFEVGTKIPRLIEGLLLSPMAVPLLYYFSIPASKTDKEEGIVFGTKIIAFIFAILSLALFSFANLLVPFLFTDVYNKSILVLQIYSFVPFFASFLILGNTHLLAVNKPLVPMLLMSTGCVILIFLDLMLIPHLGIIGAALSGVTVTFLFVIGNLIYLTHRQIFMGKLFCKFLFGIILSGCLNYFVSYSAIVVFILYIWISRLITLDDVRTIYELAKELLNRRLDRSIPT